MWLNFNCLYEKPASLSWLRSRLDHKFLKMEIKQNIILCASVTSLKVTHGIKFFIVHMGRWPKSIEGLLYLALFLNIDKNEIVALYAWRGKLKYPLTNWLSMAATELMKPVHCPHSPLKHGLLYTDHNHKPIPIPTPTLYNIKFITSAKIIQFIENNEIYLSHQWILVEHNAAVSACQHSHIGSWKKCYLAQILSHK